MAVSEKLDWQDWARSQNKQNAEAVIHRLRITMAGLYKEPAIFH